MLTFIFVIPKASLLFYACSFSMIPSSFLMDGRVFHTFLWLLMRAFFETFFCFFFPCFCHNYTSVYLFWGAPFYLGSFLSIPSDPFFLCTFQNKAEKPG